MMPKKHDIIAEAVSNVGIPTGREIEVRLSNELVQLLSDQLYQSPVKAIEELVVNSYDADAKVCRVYVPEVEHENEFVVVFDDGVGMNEDGLQDLWQIGRSNKRSEEIQRRRERKQIGKFGIGKLATYAIANKLTYITRSEDNILSVTLDYTDFSRQKYMSESAGQTKEEPIKLVLRRIDLNDLVQESAFIQVCEVAEIDIAALLEAERWTFAILEELKAKAKTMSRGVLRWVLRTAMPLRDDFLLFLNGERVVSAKADYETIVHFHLHELPQSRLDHLAEETDEKWETEDGRLVSPSFPSGITGEVIVTDRSLYGGKSSDLRRSHGFFVRVLGRGVSLSDPLFGGLHPLSYAVFNKFRADIQADDLDRSIIAPREGLEESDITRKFRVLLTEIFNEAAVRFNKEKRERDKKEAGKKEHERNYVDPTLVEYPTADAISTHSINPTFGAEADETWFYLDVNKDADLRELSKRLYTKPFSRHARYKYEYANEGVNSRLVRFDPVESTFYINIDHDFARNYIDDDMFGSYLLEDIVTAEAMLEIYLYENHVAAHVIGEVLEKRDALLRSLAKDHRLSLRALAEDLRDAKSNERDLEVALVAATRALGFVAKHVSGAGEPDGIARFNDYYRGERRITLEAKSSQDTPQLTQIDVSGLVEHMKKYQAHGCLLVSPSYPGATRDEDERAISKRAKHDKISCWTVEQFASFIAAAEARHFTAQDLLDIVLNKFSPEEVSRELERKLAPPNYGRALYRAIIEVLKESQTIMPNDQREVGMIHFELARQTEFADLSREVIRQAILDLASSSQGGMRLLKNDQIQVNASWEEIERRLNGLIRTRTTPRRPSTFRDN